MDTGGTDIGFLAWLANKCQWMVPPSAGATITIIMGKDFSLLRIIGDQVKLSSWYDNEWGYSNRLVDLTEYVAERL